VETVKYYELIHGSESVLLVVECFRGTVAELLNVLYFFVVVLPIKGTSLHQLLLADQKTTGELKKEILIMSGDPNAVLQAAKKQLNECDKDIGAIRAVLRGLGTTAEHEAVNELTLEWLNPPVRVSRMFFLYAFISVPARMERVMT
jgi:hypothetical protein